MGNFGLTGIGALLTGGDIAGSTADLYGRENVFGRRPDVAEFTPTDLTEEQRRALEGNLTNADSIEALLNRMVPGWSDMLRQGTTNATSLLRGEIPQDVQDQVMRNSAYQALQGGYAGSGMSKALTARDFGRTSLDLQQMGNNSAQQWAKLAESSYSPFMNNLEMQANMTQANNAGQQATEQYRFNVEASPDPAAAAIYGMNSAIGMQMLNFGIGAAGGAMAGGGGGSGGGAQQPYGGGAPYGYNYGQPFAYSGQLSTRPTWGG